MLELGNETSSNGSDSRAPPSFRRGKTASKNSRSDGHPLKKSPLREASTTLKVRLHRIRNTSKDGRIHTHNLTPFVEIAKRILQSSPVPIEREWECEEAIRLFVDSKSDGEPSPYTQMAGVKW